MGFALGFVTEDCANAQRDGPQKSSEQLHAQSLVDPVRLQGACNRTCRLVSNANEGSAPDEAATVAERTNVASGGGSPFGHPRALELPRISDTSCLDTLARWVRER